MSPFIYNIIFVSIHAPTWGATLHDGIFLVLCRFQSTRPRGARRRRALAAARTAVSIHAPTWGATKSSCCCGQLNNSFNPRAHVGRDFCPPIRFYRYRVSIHAPTWGATTDSGSGGGKEKVSIHAPTWGATSSAPTDRGTRKCFNPRAHVGRDTTQGCTTTISACFNPRAHVGRDYRHRGKLGRIAVSIHAPTWGAILSLYLRRRCIVFQSTRPRGARPVRVYRTHVFRKFQSTRPRGARPLSNVIVPVFLSFNPRAHVGRDFRAAPL